MRFSLKVKNKEYEVELLETGQGEVKITVEGEEFIFNENRTEKKVAVAKTALPKRNFSREEIKAPITGVISEVFVKQGEFIKEGQKVLSLSSMKMENEIISDFAGKITEVLVKENQKVEGGDILLILK